MLIAVLVNLVAGEILDIRSDDPQKHEFLKHHRDSLQRLDLSDTPPITRKVLGSVRRSRLTPHANPQKGEKNGGLFVSGWMRRIERISGMGGGKEDWMDIQIVSKL